MNNELQQRSPETQAGQTAWKRRVVQVDELFGILRLAYPNFYRGEDLDAAKRFWAKDLGWATEQDIKSAMEKMTDEFPARAPTVGQFKQLCKRMQADRPETTILIELDELCPRCRGHRKSQHHADTCEV